MRVRVATAFLHISGPNQIIKILQKTETNMQNSPTSCWDPMRAIAGLSENVMLMMRQSPLGSLVILYWLTTSYIAKETVTQICALATMSILIFFPSGIFYRSHLWAVSIYKYKIFIWNATINGWNDRATMIELHWLPVEARVQFKLCLLVHHTVIGNAPTYIADLSSYSSWFIN